MDIVQMKYGIYGGWGVVHFEIRKTQTNYEELFSEYYKQMRRYQNQIHTNICIISLSALSQTKQKITNQPSFILATISMQSYAIENQNTTGVYYYNMQSFRNNQQLTLHNIHLTGANDDQLLKIEFQDHRSRVIYDVTITSDFFRQDPYLPVIFEDLSSFQAAVEKHIESIKVNQKGQIVYLHKTKMATKSIVLPTKMNITKIFQPPRESKASLTSKTQYQLAKNQNRQINDNRSQPGQKQIRELEKDYQAKLQIVKLRFEEREEKLTQKLNNNLRNTQQKLREIINKHAQQSSQISQSIESIKNNQIKLENTVIENYRQLSEQIKQLNSETASIKSTSSEIDQLIMEKIEQINNKFDALTEDVSTGTQRISKNLEGTEGDNHLKNIQQPLTVSLKKNQSIVSKKQEDSEQGMHDRSQDQNNYEQRRKIQGIERIPLILPGFNKIIPYPHSDKFRTQLLDNKQSITFIKEGNSTTFETYINKGSIPAKAITTHKIRQAKTTKNCIMTGIATDAIVGKQNAFTNRQCVVYAHWGCLFQNEDTKQTKRPIKDGEVVCIDIDTQNWWISWRVESETVIEAAIPKQMRTKPLFLVILMVHTNDTVELLMNQQ